MSNCNWNIYQIYLLPRIKLKAFHTVLNGCRLLCVLSLHSLPFSSSFYHEQQQKGTRRGSGRCYFHRSPHVAEKPGATMVLVRLRAHSIHRDKVWQLISTSSRWARVQTKCFSSEWGHPGECMSRWPEHKKLSQERGGSSGRHESPLIGRRCRPSFEPQARYSLASVTAKVCPECLAHRPKLQLDDSAEIF